MTQPIRMAALALGLLATGPALADTALLVGNVGYTHAPDVRGARFVGQARQPLSEVGFQVVVGGNAQTSEIRDALADIVNAGEQDRILIHLSGQFVHSDDGESWFLGTEARQPNRGNIGGQGIAMSTIMAIAADVPGRALVVLGVADSEFATGPGLSPGITLPEAPQGVALVVTTPRQASRIVRDSVPQEGVSLAEILADYPDAITAGFIPDFMPFIGDFTSSGLFDPVVTPQLPGGSAILRDNDSAGDGAGNAEDDLWAAVRELNTEGAYISYLRQYPTGRYASEARAGFEALRDPLRVAAEEESALGLNRTARREIQADLTVLGFDTNGIDGIFGNGTRAAIRGWQASIGLAETGHMNQASLRRLSSSADLRREEIAEEEAIRQAERDRLDRAYWAATGRGQDEPGLRAYLSRYPEGLFADIASDRIADIEGDRADAEAAEQEAAWDFAARQDSIRAYRGYLAIYPDGDHVRDARNRIAELRGEPLPFPEVNTAELEAAEAALNLPGITRMLIERRLSDQGYRPGTPDGRFDDQTRAAILAFQQANGLTATGYLDRETLARFLSDGFQVIIR